MKKPPSPPSRVLAPLPVPLFSPYSQSNGWRRRHRNSVEGDRVGVGVGSLVRAAQVLAVRVGGPGVNAWAGRCSRRNAFGWNSSNEIDDR